MEKRSPEPTATHSGQSQPVVVETRDLVRKFGEHTAVDGLSLTVRRGECLGLLGPNGAGKTTTIRILSTLAAPTSGFVRVLGLDPARAAAEIRTRIGVVQQDIALYEDLTAVENLEFFGRMFGVVESRLAERVTWAIEQAGLVDRAQDRVGVYSGGMRRRLNIVAALLHAPELVFLDEPTVGVDPQSRNHVYEMVEGLRAGGTTLIYTTHQLGEVERLCDRVTILDRGRQVAAGTLADLQQLEAGRVARKVRIDCGARSDEAARVLAERGIAYTVEEEKPGLEEIFLSLTGRALRDDE